MFSDKYLVLTEDADQHFFYVPKIQASYSAPIQHFSHSYYFVHISQTSQRSSQMLLCIRITWDAFWTGFLGPIPRISESVSLRWSPFIIIPFPSGDAGAVWEIHHWTVNFEVRLLSYHFVYSPKDWVWLTACRSSILILVNWIHLSTGKG